MNCFHFSVSLGYKTTGQDAIYFPLPLWIAFIFQYLWDTKQRKFVNGFSKPSCELLSFFSIFGIQNNFLWRWQRVSTVVNCFHFSVSLGYKTTNKNNFNATIGLWIAFIFQYLWDTKQQVNNSNDALISCELLSFFSIFGIQNNAYNLDLESFLVVNCFHFSVSLGYKTTTMKNTFGKLLLWIAFIFQYLWDTKQRC